MGLLQRLFGGKPGWTPRPFVKNTSADEYREWFAHVPPWATVPQRVLDAYIETMGGNKFFELFVVTATEQGLIPRLASMKLLAEAGLPFAIRARTAGMLCELGQSHLVSLTQLMRHPKGKEDETSVAFRGAMNCFESAITVEPMFALAYGQLAATVMHLNKWTEALEWCRKGIAVVESQKSHPAAARAPEDIRRGAAEVESQLRRLLRDIESHHVRQDLGAYVPPTLARALDPSAAAPRTAVDQEQLLKRASEWKRGSQVDRIFQEIESRTESFVEAAGRLPETALLAKLGFGNYARESTLPLVFGLIVVRRAAGPRYFILSEWKQLVALVEQRMTRVGLSAIESLGADSKSLAASVKEGVEKHALHRMAGLQAVLYGFVSRDKMTGTRDEMVNAVVRWYLAAMGMDADMAQESDLAALASTLADEILNAGEPT